MKSKKDIFILGALSLLILSGNVYADSVKIFNDSGRSLSCYAEYKGMLGKHKKGYVIEMANNTYNWFRAAGNFGTPPHEALKKCGFGPACRKNPKKCNLIPKNYQQINKTRYYCVTRSGFTKWTGYTNKFDYSSTMKCGGKRMTKKNFNRTTAKWIPAP